MAGPAARQAAQTQHFTRSQTRLHYKAAGVLPFAFQHGMPVVLLGAEAVKTGPKGKITKTMWRDFGGQREAIDTDSESTASREFAEETMGLFGGCDVNGSCVAACTAQMHTQLSSGQNVLKVVHQLKKGEYHMYITQTPHIDPLMFHLALQQNDETDAVCGAEKTAFAWVALSDLLQATVTCAKRYFLYAQAHTTGDRRQPVFHGVRRMQLHPCFASSLRLAQEAGLSSLIAAARTATIAQPAIQEALPQLMLADQPCPNQVAFMEQCNDPLRSASPQHSNKEPVADLLCLEATQQDDVQQKGSMFNSIPVAKLAAVQPASIGLMAGLTPEHMLYWISQAGVAEQLRCNQTAGTAAGNQVSAELLVHSQAGYQANQILGNKAAAASAQLPTSESKSGRQQVSRRVTKQKPASRSGSIRKASRSQPIS